MTPVCADVRLFPVSPRFVVHGNDVFDGGERLQVVAWCQYVAGMVAGQRVNAVAYFGTNFVRRAERKNLLVLDAAMETDPFAEIILQCRQFHAGTTPLHWIQDLNANLDEIRQECAHPAVVMVEHFYAKLPAQLDEALVVRLVEFPVKFEAEHRSVLVSEIVGDLGNVNQPRRGLECAAMAFVLEIASAAQQVVRQLRFGERIHQGLLHASQDIMDVHWRHVAAHDGLRGVMSLGNRLEARVIKPIGARPFVLSIMTIIWLWQPIKSRWFAASSAIPAASAPGAMGHEFTTACVFVSMTATSLLSSMLQ